MEFDWDSANLRHIARHGITPIEVEESMLDPLAKEMEPHWVGDEVRFRQIGATISGRLLVVAYTMRGMAVRPVTAFNPVRSETKAYRDGGFE